MTHINLGRLVHMKHICALQFAELISAEWALFFVSHALGCML